MNRELRGLYEEMILDHNRHPRNYPKEPAGSTHHAHGFNRLCGDEFTVHVKVRDGLIEDVGFEGAGCAISTASASLMTEAVKGRKIEDAESLFECMHTLLTGEVPEGVPAKLAVLGGVREYPSRVKCATLPWHTLHAALARRAEPVSTEDDSPPACEAPADD